MCGFIVRGVVVDASPFPLQCETVPAPISLPSPMLVLSLAPVPIWLRTGARDGGPPAVVRFLLCLGRSVMQTSLYRSSLVKECGKRQAMGPPWPSSGEDAMIASALVEYGE
ncbi:hypothetical protein Y032_0395g647 [Ancylostoma ceylanicum]|uniref:Uncharacterized protein n=1 Tax=Ancylostoma ceylanicum TaxID=53326 RepID=A0A016RSN5_9BILA|nr:hypothetical protein Y032_0395g647 [Ancylostoma ceylanicum]